MQGSAKEVPKLFNPAEEYNDKSVLLVTLAQKTITLTAKEVTGMPWPQFVRLMKVSATCRESIHFGWEFPLFLTKLGTLLHIHHINAPQSLWAIICIGRIASALLPCQCTRAI